VRFLLTIPAALALTACAGAPDSGPTWQRIDREEITPARQVQFERDELVCKGEANKAALSSTASACGGLYCLPAAAGRANALDSVMAGCMAGRGYRLLSQ
jgi:hypothetical protein